MSFSDAGNIALLDKYGNVFEALLESGCGNGRGSSTIGDDVASSGSEGRNYQRNDGISYVFNPEPMTHLGSGRPLGSHYDAEGNLIVCDSLKVRRFAEMKGGTVMNVLAGGTRHGAMPAVVHCTRWGVQKHAQQPG